MHAASTTAIRSLGYFSKAGQTESQPQPTWVQNALKSRRTTCQRERRRSGEGGVDGAGGRAGCSALRGAAVATYRVEEVHAEGGRHDLDKGDEPQLVLRALVEELAPGPAPARLADRRLREEEVVRAHDREDAIDVARACAVGGRAGGLVGGGWGSRFSSALLRPIDRGRRRPSPMWRSSSGNMVHSYLAAIAAHAFACVSAR